MKKEILICDFCGHEGHDPLEPSKDCINALKREIAALNLKITTLEQRQHITIPLTPKDDRWPHQPYTPFDRNTIVD